MPSPPRPISGGYRPSTASPQRPETGGATPLIYVFRTFRHADRPVEMSTQASKSYLRNAILQASPEQLQLMLFDGAIRHTLKGREAIERHDYEQTYESLSLAQRIVLEMDAGLRPEVNAELCEQMSALYNFVYHKLVSANVKRDVSNIDDALHILQHQRETWVMLLDKVRHAKAEQSPPAGVKAAAAEGGSVAFEG